MVNRLENLRRFALTHCGVSVARIENDCLFIGFATFPDASTFERVRTLAELRNFLGY